MNIYLVRHGESMGNVDRTLSKSTPDHALPLSPRGELQAAAAGEALTKLINLRDPDAKVRIWTSPYKRTRQTANQIFAKLNPVLNNVDMREHINLCEQQFGLFDGVPEEDLPHLFPAEHAHYALAEAHEGRFWARMPMGESRFDVAVRVHEAFGTFHRDATYHGVENLVVICHGVTLRAFVMQWLHLPYEWMDKQPNPGNCDIFQLSDDLPSRGEYVYRTPTDL